MKSIQKIPEALLGLLALAALGVAAMLMYGVSLLTGRTVCPFYNLYHIPCPSCGMTRGFFAIFRLDFIAAFHYNRLAIPLFAALSVYGILCLFDLLTGGSLIKKINRFFTKKPVLMIVIGIILINWVVHLVT